MLDNFPEAKKIYNFFSDDNNSSVIVFDQNNTITVVNDKFLQETAYIL